MELDLSDDLSRIWYFWGYGGYEKATTRLFTKLLASKECVFDIGANFGYYSFLAASILSGSARAGSVHAFEPNPNVFRWLSQNAVLNALPCLHINPEAVCDVDGHERLYLCSSDDTGTNASLVPGLFNQHLSTAVKTVRFDSYCQMHSIHRVDLIKMDCEGAEARVIRGMGGLLDAWRPDIICEVLEPNEGALQELFQKTPYRKFLISDKGLMEVGSLRADPSYRDYYLTCAKSVPQL